jgi:hypothetical protein
VDGVGDGEALFLLTTDCIDGVGEGDDRVGVVLPPREGRPEFVGVLDLELPALRVGKLDEVLETAETGTPALEEEAVPSRCMRVLVLLHIYIIIT